MVGCRWLGACSCRAAHHPTAACARPLCSGAYNLYALADHLHRRGLYRNLFEVRWSAGGAGCTAAVCCFDIARWPKAAGSEQQAGPCWPVMPQRTTAPRPAAGHSLSGGQAHAARAVPNLPHPVRRRGGACVQPGCGCMPTTEPRCTHASQAACYMPALSKLASALSPAWDSLNAWHTLDIWPCLRPVPASPSFPAPLPRPALPQQAGRACGPAPAAHAHPAWHHRQVGAHGDRDRVCGGAQGKLWLTRGASCWLVG